MKGWLKVLSKTSSTCNIQLAVYAKPGAKETKIKGSSPDGSSLMIALKAEPVDGQANSCLIDFLAETLNVKKSDIELVRGTTSRHKFLEIKNVALDALVVFNKIEIG